MKRLFMVMIGAMLIFGCIEPAKANQPMPPEPKPVHIIEHRDKSAFEKELGQYVKAGWRLESFTVTQEIGPSGWGSESRGIELYIAVVSQKL